jgi:GTPase SAR1 family protein
MINSNVTSHHGMLFKVVIVGESGVGKSTISKQYADGVFE